MKRISAAFFLTTLGLFFIYFIFPNHVFADQNFAISLQSTYSVTSTGDTFVEQQYQLTNNTPAYYAKDYAVVFNSKKLKSIRSFTDQGDLPTVTTESNNRTTVTVSFPDKMVGEGKSRSFTVAFENPETAQVSGNILEVDIPQLEKSDSFEKNTVLLKTPIQYGSPVRVTPSNFQINNDGKMISTSFLNVANQSISALFGNKQIFDFTVSNNINNPTSNLGIIQLALPPDTARQKVSYLSLAPPPKDISRDPDGNWIATYEVAAQKNLQVTFIGKAFLSLEDSQQLHLPAPTQSWLNPQAYWESTNSQITELAKKYQTPKSIYDYVVSHLSYNYQRAQDSNNTRLGAAGVLNNPTNAVCQEFTDLFISLARANHIPARRAVGYAYTANSQLRPLSFGQDTLHTWPEYFDQSKNSWIPVDPTWGNTTGGVDYFSQFDFNHLVFSYNGVSSTLPFAAGSYRTERQVSNNIEVKFGNEAPLPNPNFKTEISTDSIWSSLINPSYTLRITNLTGVAWYNLPITVQSDKSEIQLSAFPTHVDYLLPYQTREVKITAQTSQRFKPIPFHLTVGVDSISSSYELTTSLNFQSALNPNIIAVSVVGGVGIIAALTWSLLVSRRPRHRAVRR